METILRIKLSFNQLLKPTSTEQCNLSFLLKPTKGTVTGFVIMPDNTFRHCMMQKCSTVQIGVFI